MSPRRAPLEERFWRFVNKTDGCWLWTGALRTTGYGVINLGRPAGIESAHRVSWVIHYGKIPTGYFVCHTCDVRPCVRPDHLFLGTSRDNIYDMIRKGRDGDTMPKKNARRTHCKRGHEFTAANTRTTHREGRNPERHCKTCEAAYDLAWKRAHADEINARKREARRNSVA